MSRPSACRPAIVLSARGVVAAMLAVGGALFHSWNVALHAQSGTIVLTPTVGVTPPVSIITVNNGPGDQYNPHVSGDLVSYSDGILPLAVRVRYFRFSTGADTVIPADNSMTDHLSDVSGTRVTFSRITSDRSAVMLFDVNSLMTTEILPETGSSRLGTAIGGNTLAFVDFSLGSTRGEIVAYDIAANLSQRLSFSDSFDLNPSVAPNGTAVVWQNCIDFVSDCDVIAASQDPITGVWSVAVLASASYSDLGPDTDGTWIAYSADPTGNPTGRDIYFKPLQGGSERQLPLPGRQEFSHISQGVISFTGMDTSETDTDLFVYVIATNTLYRITSTAGVNESLNDIDVLPNGNVRLAWNANDGPGGERNVYATTVRVPLTTTYQTCLLYDPHLVKKSGSAFPIKVQACDGSGNNLSSPSLSLRAVSVTQVSTSVVGQVDSTGNANPDSDFRYDAALAGYVFNLSTRGLSTGTYTLNFTIGSDATVYSVPFAIK